MALGIVGVKHWHSGNFIECPQAILISNIALVTVEDRDWCVHLLVITHAVATIETAVQCYGSGHS